MNYTDFKRSVLRLNEKRVFKVNNSLGVYDAYKWIRKHNWLNIGKPVSEHNFYKIIRTINKYFINNFIEGKDINLPYRMGRLELRKFNASFKVIDNKIVTNLPIDWNNTLKYWSENEEAYNSKTLLKLNEKEIFKIYYNKETANFKNKSFYEFKPNRTLKLLVKNNIKNNNLDAYGLE